MGFFAFEYVFHFGFVILHLDKERNTLIALEIVFWASHLIA